MSKTTFPHPLQLYWCDVSWTVVMSTLFLFFVSCVRGCLTTDPPIPKKRLKTFMVFCSDKGRQLSSCAAAVSLVLCSWVSATYVTIKYWLKFWHLSRYSNIVLYIYTIIFLTLTPTSLSARMVRVKQPSLSARMVRVATLRVNAFTVNNANWSF